MIKNDNVLDMSWKLYLTQLVMLGIVMIDDEVAYDKMNNVVNPHGDNMSYGRIVEFLK